MTNRTTRNTMVFRRPFHILGIDHLLPAGSYEVVTEEELLPALSFLAYRRLQTYIYLRSSPASSAGSTPTYFVDPNELDAAFVRDRNGGHAPEKLDLVAGQSLQDLPGEFDRASDDGMFIGPNH